MSKPTDREAGKVDLLGPWKYLRKCDEYSTKHWVVWALTALVTLYGFVAGIAPFLDIPPLGIELPKVRLEWGAIIILGLVLFLVFEGGYKGLQKEIADKQLIEKEKRDLETKNQELINQRGADLIVLERATDEVDRLSRELQRRNIASEWRDLAGRFEKYKNSLVFADWQETEGENDYWAVRGGVQGGADARECESLCRLAGAMLRRSARVFSSLSDIARSELNDVKRWLFFLKERGCLERPLVGVETRGDGTTRTMTAWQIGNLPAASARECLYCESIEISATTTF